MKIESLLELIEKIKNTEWKFHASDHVICQIFESNKDWYFSIYIKKTNQGSSVSAVFDLRFADRELPVENIAYSRAKSIVSILEESKKRLIEAD